MQTQAVPTNPQLLGEWDHVRNGRYTMHLEPTTRTVWHCRESDQSWSCVCNETQWEAGFREVLSRTSNYVSLTEAR